MLHKGKNNLKIEKTEIILLFQTKQMQKQNYMLCSHSDETSLVWSRMKHV